MTEKNSQAFVSCEKIIEIVQELRLVLEVHKDLRQCSALDAEPYLVLARVYYTMTKKSLL